jgi:hypothetical protein
VKVADYLQKSHLKIFYIGSVTTMGENISQMSKLNPFFLLYCVLNPGSCAHQASVLLGSLSVALCFLFCG